MRLIIALLTAALVSFVFFWIGWLVGGILGIMWAFPLNPVRLMFRLNAILEASPAQIAAMEATPFVIQDIVSGIAALIGFFGTLLAFKDD